MKIKKTHDPGFTLLEVIIVSTIIGLLAVIVVPAFMKSRREAQQKACWNNLLKLDEAVDQWAMERHKNTGDPVVADEVYQYIKGGPPQCPSGGTYGFSEVTDFSASCSFSTGDAPHDHYLPNDTE